MSAVNRRIAAALLGLTALNLAAYRFRRPLIARWLGLPPARYDVAVERNLPVPMPDGIVLRADHYTPRPGGPFPTILIRSPYGRGREALPGGLAFMFIAQRFAERGYHVLFQDVRGRFDSGGAFDPLVHEAADGRATADWIAQQPWFDGRLATWGPSYLGYVQWALAATAPPYLKALVPIITGSEFTSSTFPDGAFALDTLLRWVAMLDAQDRSGLNVLRGWRRQQAVLGDDRRLEAAFRHLPLEEADLVAVGQPVLFYRRWLTEPPTADAPRWRATDYSAAVAQVTAPVHLVGGWYDFLLRQLLADYTALAAAGRAPYLTIGPWAHLDGGVLWEGLRAGLIWFGAQLKGDRSRLRARPVRYYLMGAEEWREAEAWPPPARETPYFLHGGGRLAEAGPAAADPPDRYRYDPADPTPSLGGALFNQNAGSRDDRALEARPDVLTYTTPPLAQAVEAVGRARLVLYVRSSRAHTDFFGRLCDVRPDGRSFNVSDGLCRLAPGVGETQADGSLRLTVALWPSAYRFRPGHRLRLLVASGAHPRWSRNLGTGEPLATAKTMFPAEQTIYHDAAHPSALILPLVSCP